MRILLQKYFLLPLLFIISNVALAKPLFPQQQHQFLPIEQAFRFNAYQENNQFIVAQWDIMPGYYLYKKHHYCWLQRGGMILYQRRVGDRRPPRRWAIKPGQVFYTPPMHEHMMRFTKDSVMLVFARNNREMAHYEADTTRVSPIAR